jgi:hypothetical protein
MPKGGYLHRIESAESLPNISMTVPKPKTAKPKMTPEELASRQIGFLNSITDIDYQVLAKAQGVSVGTLRYFGVGCHFSFDHASECYTIPQRSLDGELCGFRTMSKTPERDKRSIFGSRTGAFFSREHISRESIKLSNYILIGEGFSDAMIAFDLGFTSVIGRSNCVGELNEIADLVEKIQPRHILIVPDADAPGRDGAAELVLEIEDRNTSTKIHNIALPEEHDIRSWCVTSAKKMEFKRFLHGRLGLRND